LRLIRHSMVRFALLLVASCVAAASALLSSSIAQCHRAPRQLGRRVPVVARSTKEDGKGEAMDLDLNQMQEMFDAAAADDAPPAPAKPEINSGLDAMKLSVTDPKAWLSARKDYDAKMAEDFDAEEGGLTRADAFKYAAVLIGSSLAGRVFRGMKEDAATAEGTMVVN